MSALNYTTSRPLHLPAEQVHLADAAPGQDVRHDRQADGAVDGVGQGEGDQKVVDGLPAQPRAGQQGVQGGGVERQAGARHGRRQRRAGLPVRRGKADAVVGDQDACKSAPKLLAAPQHMCTGRMVPIVSIFGANVDVRTVRFK